MKTPDTHIGYAAMACWTWRAMAGVRGRVVLRCAVGVARVALVLAFVWVSRSLVDAAVDPSTSVHSLVLMSAMLAVLLLAEIGAGLIARMLAQKADALMRMNLRRRLFNRIMHSRWIDRSSLHSTDLTTRLADDVRTISDMATTSLPQAAVMLVQFAGAFALFCLLSWKLALCVAAIAPLFVVLGKIYSRKANTLAASLRQAESDMQVTLQEGLSHQDTIQAFQAQDFTAGRADAAHDKVWTATMARLRLGLSSQALSQLGFALCYLTAFFWSIWHLHTGEITFGSMAAFLQLVGRIQAPVSSLARQVPAIAQAAASVQRLIDIDKLPTESCALGHYPEQNVGVRFSGVSFSYSESCIPVLSDFSYDFAPGSRTVITGATGAGKTTIARLMLGQIEPQKGKVDFYGASDKTLSVPSQITYVPQGNSLLACSIRDNLLLAAPESSDHDLRQALHAAVADFVYGLPQGIDTVCNERGCNLSEGQAQRIAIARALLRRRPVMILDEFDSALDRATARTVLDRLLEACPHATLIIISHRQDLPLGFDHLTIG